ncbi:hypothetical protein CDA63_04160 [Hymenobacter amundsenii]|uniref:DUF4844 domain-containing protein n=1 Tax=Hymenobacter amundsenii TaxID=2006685 RepID=A0A246FNJ0_9BACT|nr:hypothetical protein [Hymenobacter amundsenii]OWP64239.1 hypothetical protein CDA63_04160 [Hymenobacter amundsenii]
MQTTLFQKLESYVTRNNFPLADWDQRGLMPSSEETQQEMQVALVDFLRFLQSCIATLAPGSKPLTLAVQEYLEEWDIIEFDTEEREYLYDLACEILLIVGVNPDDISI